MKRPFTFPVFYKTFLVLYFSILLFSLSAQPNADLVSVNSQHFISAYSDSSKNRFYSQDNFLSLLLPVKFGMGHIFMLRINAEHLTVSRSTNTSENYSLYSLSVPIGFQWQSKNEKWKYAGLIIPKINSDFADNLDYDGQLGGIGLITRVFSEKLQVRAGLYYNSDFWGNFFMPLGGIDWKVNDRFRMYGTLPGNYRFEFKLGKKIYTGVGFRSAQRSFRLQKKYNDDFVRVKENQIKIFFEGFIVGKILIGIDVYRSIGYNMIRYDYFETKKPIAGLNVFTKSRDNFGLTFNLAYRIRTD